MLGDPRYVLSGTLADSRQQELDDAQELLDAHVNAQGDETRLSAARNAAKQALADEPNNQRLRAASYLVESTTSLTNLGDPAQMAELALNLRLADELHHLPTKGLLSIKETEHKLEVEDRTGKLAALQTALMVLEPAKWFSTILGQFYGKYLFAWYQLRGEEREQTDRIIGQPDEKLRKTMEAFGSTLRAQAAGVEWEAFRQESWRRDARGLKDPEEDLEDIVWNAYVINYPNRFEDMRESAAFCSLLANKLVNRRYLADEALPYASTVLVGIFRVAWDLQDLLVLKPELIDAWTSTIIQAIDDIRAEWSPPVGKPWFEIVRMYPQKVDETLAFLDSLSWTELYDHLDKEIEELGQHGQDLLEQVNQDYPEATAACAAYVMGTLIEKNSFSPWSGSVSESIGDRMRSAYRKLASIADGGYFHRYQWVGFEKVRSPPVQSDELARWRSRAK
jgi:hypothetical protein